MKLTDNEKRDVVKLIEEGRVLPERYRFLLFDESKQVDLSWNGKTNDLTKVVFPFQVIEQVDEPRNEVLKELQLGIDFDTGRQKTGWSNKLIWGDNKYVVSSLLHGSFRKDIDNEGGVKLIYIDPPFSVGQDYTIQVKIGNDDFYQKKPTFIENYAYRNTWNNKGNSFLQMLYSRVSLMRDLLSNDGALILRIDHHWGHYVKVMLDSIFGKNNFRNEIFINRVKKNTTTKTRQLSLTTSIESLFVYSKSDDFEYKDTSYDLEVKKESYWRATDDSSGTNNNPSRFVEGKEYFPRSGCHFKFSQEKMDTMYKEGRIRINKNTNRVQYLVGESSTGIIDTNWTDIPGYSFSTKYPTENSEKLLTRVIKSFTNENDLVCDFFNGSGTTAAVCEKLNRKWIVSDLGKFSIHVTKKRLIKIQRENKKIEKDWRSFELLNIGKYQKQHYLSDEVDERDPLNKEISKKREQAFQRLILEAYSAEVVNGFKSLHGKKGNTFVSIGPVNHNVTRDQIEQIIDECVNNNITTVDVLGFEYEMGLFPSIQDDAKSKGLNLSYKQIPSDIFNDDEVAKSNVTFNDVAHIDFKVHVIKNKISVELLDFAPMYSDDDANIYQNLKKNQNNIVIRNHQIVEVKKDKDGNVNEVQLTKNWHDWIDYWSIDYDYERRPEIVKFLTNDNKVEEEWTGNYIFENEWQAFRSSVNNSILELKSSQKELQSSSTKIAVKVVDIFGNDTMKVMEVKI
jgi:DNA modification methylase